LYIDFVSELMDVFFDAQDGNVCVDPKASAAALYAW
jgi:hypothetical protein